MDNTQVAHFHVNILYVLAFFLAIRVFTINTTLPVLASTVFTAAKRLLPVGLDLMINELRA